MATHTQPITTTAGACGSCKCGSQISPYTTTHKTVKVQGYINQAPTEQVCGYTQCELAVSQHVTQKEKRN